MTVTELVGLLKLKLGIRSSAQDVRLEHLIEAVIEELTVEKGITIVMDNPRHTSFITDYAEYRYKNATEDMPRYLMHRLYNLYLKDKP